MDERRTVINSLIDLRNRLISQGKYTDIIDELLIKLTKAKTKKQGKGGLNYSDKDYIHSTGRLLVARFEIAWTTEGEIGIWGKRQLRYLKNHHPIIYTNLLTSCKLTAYLADIDKQAEEMFFSISKATCSARGGITEQLKADNQMLWVRKMNNIHNRAQEIVNAELIYT